MKHEMLIFFKVLMPRKHSSRVFMFLAIGSEPLCWAAGGNTPENANAAAKL